MRPIKDFYRTYGDNTPFLLALFILFWPLAVYLMWRHRKWNVQLRTTITAVLAGLTLLVGVIGYNAPPTISLANRSIATGYKTDDEFVVITGDISMLHSPQLSINGKQVSVGRSGNFSYRLPLNEGDTDVTIIATSEKGDDKQHFKVHRTTAAELAERKKAAEEKAEKAKVAAIKALPVCDGTNVTANCKTDDGIYKTYVYHPAVPGKTHQETKTTYKEQVTGYCTLCADGTYSPSCATGRGACSWHGGVAQWNAPRINKVPVYDTQTVVDETAKEAYYDKVPDRQFE